MTVAQLEKRLGSRMRTFENKAIMVERMLSEAGYMVEKKNELSDAILKTKGKVYDQIVQCLAVEGYPTESDQSILKEGNIKDLVFASILPIIYAFRLKTGRDGIQLSGEKQVVSVG